jgi:hypothetical protein
LRFIGCKRAALGWPNRASNPWFTGCKRAVGYRRKWTPNTAVYRLQEGSLVLTQEGVKAVVYRLQESSLVVAQEGANHVVTGCKRAARNDASGRQNREL